MKNLNPDGTPTRSLRSAFGDFEDMYIDFYRFISIGAIVPPARPRRGCWRSMDGNPTRQ
jgi:hypothetical protein